MLITNEIDIEKSFETSAKHLLLPVELAIILKSKSESLLADYYVAHMCECFPAAQILADINSGITVIDQVEVPSLFLRSHRFFSGKMKFLDIFYEYFSKSQIAPSQKVITVGDALGQYLKTTYGLADCTTLENYPEEIPIDEPVNIKEKLGLDANCTLILYPNNILPSFEFERVLKWFQMLPDNYHLVSIGRVTENLVEPLNSSMAEYGITDRVHLMGFIDYFEYQNYAQGADVALIARNSEVLNNKLALPNRIFDVIRSGLPVMSYDAPDIENIIRKHKIGLVYRHGDSDEEIVKLIKELVKRVDEFRPNVIKTAEKLSWANQTEKLLSVFPAGSTVTFIGLRNLYKNQRTLRMAKTIVENGGKVHIASIGNPSDAPEIEGVEYISF